MLRISRVMTECFRPSCAWEQSTSFASRCAVQGGEENVISGRELTLTWKTGSVQEVDFWLLELSESDTTTTTGQWRGKISV